MALAQDSKDTPHLDDLPSLPGRNKASIALLLLMQALNSFNDNFVKMLFIALALTVAAHTNLGDRMQVYLGLIFSVPYILFAPLAGFLSDRYSKKRVSVAMQGAQVVVFALFALILGPRNPQWCLMLSLAVFFLLATQAAFFSPAKMGMIKELAGSRRLGMVSGWVQMSLMAAVLTGMWAGGTVFGHQLLATGDAWHSARLLVMVVGTFALLQLVCALGIQSTPTHPEVKFRPAMFWEHFSHLRLLFHDRPIRLASLGITFFWFLSNSLATILVTLGHEAHAGDPGEASKAVSMMAALLGVGIVVGSLLASWICKRRIELGLVPFGGLGLAIGLIWTGLLPLGSSYLPASLLFIGAAAGCFMVPLYAFVQDRAKPEERARILSGVNLMDSLATVLAMGVVWLYLQLGLRASTQILTLVVPSVGASIFMLKLLPQQFVRLLCLTIIRSIYRVRAVNPERVPHTGGVLILPNHVSYVDAAILAVSCGRSVRFVIWDSLYHNSAIHRFLRLFDTVPISPTRAKEAIRTVAAALKEGQAVCLFPEGQITRVGALNEVLKGYEIMARQAGAPVVPVFMDGLWGSFFSFKGGKYFNKLPRRRTRHAATVHFGEPIPAAQAKAAYVREVMLKLGSEAFLNRPAFHGSSASPLVLATSMRLANVELFQSGDTLLLLGAKDTIIASALSRLPEVSVVFSLDDAAVTDGKRLIAIGTAEQLRTLAASTAWRQHRGCQAICWQDESEVALPDIGVPILRGWLHEPSGVLVSTELPDPPMPPGSEEEQRGRRVGSLGRLLPGLAARQEKDRLIIKGLAPDDDRSLVLANGRLDDGGFIKVEAPSAEICQP